MNQNEKIRVSCLGDSITFGLMATSPGKSYPSVLQLMLGETYEVINFGLSGATVINDFDIGTGAYYPYTKSEEYKKALESNPDIVILMLGMNDANPTHHFNKENGGCISEYYMEFYQTVLTDLIMRLQNLPTLPKVYLIKTTQMRRKVEDGYDPDYVKNFLENLVKIREIQEKVAQTTKINLIDTCEDMQKDSYYNDGCHLTDVGYHKLGEVVWKNLKAYSRFEE